MTERPPPDEPDEAADEDNPGFDRFEQLTKKLLGVDDEPGEDDEKG